MKEKTFNTIFNAFILLGMLAAKKLNEKVAKRVVIIMLILSGVAMILTNVL